MRVFKGDAKTAFLQGSVGDQELICEPIAELSQALGLEHQQCVRLRKSVYGLIDAPRAWWERVETDMKRLNWRTLTTEPCFWVKTSMEGQIESLAVASVDDFMIAVNEESPISQKHFTDLKALYEWGEWESGSFPSAECRSCNIDTRIVGVASLCLVHNMQSRWFYWICRQQDVSSVRIR